MAGIPTLAVTVQILHPEHNPLSLRSHVLAVRFCFFAILSILVFSTAVSHTSFIISSASFFPTLFSASFPYFSMISCILSNGAFLILYTLLIPSSQNPSPSPLMTPPPFSWQHLPARDPAPLPFLTAAFPASVCELGVGCGLKRKTKQGYVQEEPVPLCSHTQGVPFVILK